MPRIQSFRRSLILATQDLAPENIAKELAKLAKQSLREAISSGEATDRYDIYVNGRFGAREEEVEAPGPILYEFQWWGEIIEFALEALRNRSPVRSGLYKSSWFAMVGNTVATDYNQIPIGAQVILTNNQPYSRKIEVGHMHMSVPPGVVEDSRGTVMSRYGNMITAKATMVMLPNPYVLKGVFSKGVRPHARTKLRKDTQSGALMTYPALVLEVRE